MLPYFIWTTIFAIRNNDIISLFRYIFITPSVWFLIALFLFDTVLFICYKFKHKFLVGFSIYLMSFAGWMFFDNSWTVIKNYAMFAPFFFGGVYFGKNKEKFVRIFKCIPFLFLYPLSMIFYTYKDSTKILVPIQKLLSGHLSKTTLNIVIKVIDEVFITFYNHFIVAPLGIIFVWAIVLWIVKKRSFTVHSNIFLILGNYTMEIYLMSGFFFIYLFSDTVNIIATLILGCVLPIIISIIINKISPKVASALFGSAHF